DEFLRVFALWNDRHDPLSSYSKGMRQKILLSAALLHNPEILILDEPFSGLDVSSALVLRRLIRGLAQEGKIVLYSSHVLEVVEKVCSQVLILRKGEVVAYDSIDRLRDLMSQPSLEGVFAQLAETEDSEAAAGKILHAMHSDSQWGGFPADRPGGVSHWLAEFGKDLRYSLRTLATSPGFTAVALISLTLGACFAICALSEMNGMVWRDLPRVTRPHELVALQAPSSYPDYKRYGDLTDVFASSMAYVAPSPFSVVLNGRAERVWGQLATPLYFSTLGVQPAYGSFFDARSAQPGEAPTVVVSYRFWQANLGSDPWAIGRTLRINGQAAIVSGVAPPGFLGAAPIIYPADIWMPLAAA